MSITLPIDSRYKFTAMTIHNGCETLGMWPDYTWIDSEPEQIIVAVTAGRLDKLANQYLGDPNLWWVLLYYNQVTDINWPRPGDEVKIPNRSIIRGMDIKKSR